jgi:Ala-tRNA(Pro) deacylase
MTPITTEPDLLDYLAAHSITYERIDHPPVFTCDEAAQYRPPAPGVETKNLFLRDNNQRFYLLVTACEKRLDLKALGQAMGVKKLHFASEAQLLDLLGLTPGAVTVLALVNDPARRVELLFDSDYWPASAYLCHPLVNTATLVIDHAGMLRFLNLTGHAPRVIEMPARA